jgi:hypothetical protein
MSSLDWESALTDQLRRASGCQQTDVLLDEAFGEIEQAGLVVHRQDGWALLIDGLSLLIPFDPTNLLGRFGSHV